MTTKIVSAIICFFLLISCDNNIGNENATAESEALAPTDSLDEKAAKELTTIFGKACTIRRDADVVRITMPFTKSSFKEEDLSVIAFAFYQLSERYKLNPYDYIKVAIKDNERTEYKFRSADFKEKAECFETVEKIGSILIERTYEDLKKHMDPEQSNAEAERATRSFKKADSVAGKINNFAIISIQFGMAGTRINVKADHDNNSSTYCSFGFDKKTNKLRYLDVKDSNSGNIQIH